MYSTMEQGSTMTSEASCSISPQAREMLALLNSLLESIRAGRRRPLLVTKVELECALPCALPCSYSEARPALIELYRVGLITFGKTVNDVFFSTPEYEAIERGDNAPRV